MYMKNGWKRCKLFLTGLVVFANTLFAQDDFSKLTDFLPAPPNAAAIARYGFISLNKNTGAPTVSVPLFTIKGNKLATSIALSYASNGIKVDEIASRAGMGWALNMGGVISRTVRGVADELRPRATPWATVGKNWATYNFVNSIVNATNSTGNDGEPDMFTFNFNGYSGSFVFDAAMNVVQLSKSDIKIAYDFNGSAWNFKITTPDGVHYYFGGISATEKTKRSSTCGKTYDYFMPNAWYLKKIAHANGEEINFTYTPHEYLYETGSSQTMYWVNSSPITSCVESSSCPTPPTTTCVNSVITQGVLLKSIEATGRTKLSITYTGRQDCNDSLISRLTFTDLIKNRTVGAFQLNYQDVVSTGLSSSLYAWGYEHTPYLSTLQEFSADEQITKTHRFNYLSPALRAYRLSYAQDHWGFYNGKNNTSFTPVPDERIIGGSRAIAAHFPAANANREADATFAKYGMLSRIDYPTGGYDSILYEGNTIRETTATLHRAVAGITGAGFKTTKSDTIAFSIVNTQELDILLNCIDNTGNGSFDPVHNFGHIEIIDATNNTIYQTMVTPGTSKRVYPLVNSGTYQLILSADGASVTTNLAMEYKPDSTLVYRNKQVGGIRVAAVFTGNHSEKPIVKKYHYALSLDSLSVSSLAIDNNPLYLNSASTQRVCGPGEILTCETIALHANSVTTLNDFQGSLLSYANVIESVGENFEGGATESYFLTRYDAPGEVLLGNAFPQAPLSNYSHAFNGKLKEEIQWKKTSNGFIPAKKTVYSYKFDARGDKEVFGYSVNGRYGLYPDYNGMAIDTTDNSLYSGTGAPTFLNIFTSRIDLMRYRTIADWTYVDSTIEYLYDEQGLNPVITISKNFYDTTAHTQVTRIETYNSKGEVLKTQYLYPTDFGGQAVYDSMVSRNILLPVTSIQFNNNNEISRVRTQFYDWGGGNIAPASVQKSFSGDSLVTEGTMDMYDASGNLLQFTGRDGVPNVILWGYGYTYPVAQVSGATYAQVSAALGVTVAQLQDMDGETLLSALNSLRTTLTQARVTTYAHIPVTGIKTMVDERNQQTSYEYDSFQRLMHIRDKDSNLVKKLEYSYAGPGDETAMPIYTNAATGSIFNCTTCITGYAATSLTYNVPEGRYYSFVSQAQADSLAAADIQANGQQYANDMAICVKTFVPTYYSAAVSGTYQKQCDAGGTGTSHTYTVNAGAYTSSISQADADQQAQNDVTANGQTYANNAGTCTWYNTVQSANFQKNNCAPGGTGSTHTYTVAAGTYSSTISQADANQKAVDDVNANGQNNANTIGICTFYNVEKSGSFQKQCDPGGTGSTHTYTVTAGTFSSTISQADADQQAQDHVNANGQNHANTIGTCTFYNVVKSGNFQKQCDAGGTGSTHTYTVAANTYSSTISQADADQQAQNDVNANGQTYANNTGTCTWYNTAQSANFQKNNCASGGTGSTQTYTVAAGTYSSTTSQADANQQAVNDVNANGQTYANTNGYCTFYSVAKSGTFQKNNCDAGGIGSSHTYTVAANAYSSTISQADADQQAQNDVNANGQTYANSVGSCTWYNTVQSASYQKNDCALGGTGSYVTYSIPAGTYSSNISQTHANNLASSAVAANGQAYANSNGYCTWYNTTQSSVFYKNNCAPGGVGSGVSYTVAAGSYSSTTSQSAADQLAINEINSNGQAYANTNGYCTFYSVAKSGTFQKDNCNAGGIGSTHTYTVAANAYSSTISQADADQKAQNDVNANGQGYVNSIGSCTWYNTSQSASFQKNDCASGGTGSYVTYTIPSGTYSSNISQTHANNLASNAVYANGQSYANSNGYCTFYNTAQSGSFQKNNCASGGTGSYVTYTVGAGAYSSTTSQAYADQLAINDVNANGQSYANNNGYCTFYNSVQSGTFQKNNCGPGGTGSYVTYTINAGGFSSTTSQAHADQLAINAVNAYGQTYANENGYCTYYNTSQSASFQKNNCASGGTGSYVTYTISAGSYVSNSSQEHANQLAQNDINANGQTYANNNGYCTFYNTVQSVLFQRNNCGSGGSGSYIYYNVPAYTYSSTVSQAHADQLALNEAYANGQAYANANANCTYYNTTQSGTFQKDNCNSSGVGSYVTYTIYAGTYYSYVSQADADQMAINAVNANGQAYANANGTCAFYSVAYSATYQKNNCGSGGTGSYVTYTVPAGAYVSSISQTHANNLASNDLNSNGQAYANSNGYCVYYNTAQSGTFTRNNCGSGYTGGQVTYTVPAGTYVSYSSQSDANQSAINDVNANGQTYANNNASCTPIQTDVFAQITYENVYDYFDGNMYGDVVVYYYANSSATVPASADNLNINYAAHDQCGSSTYDTFYGAYGYYSYLYFGATLSYAPWWCGYPCYSPCYIGYQLTTGTGYIPL